MQLADQCQTRFRHGAAEVGPPNRRAHLDDHLRQLRLAGLHGRLTDGDAVAALVSELEGHGKPVGLFRRFLFELGAELRVGPLAGDVHRAERDGPAQTRGGNRRVGVERPGHRRFERQGRRSRGGALGGLRAAAGLRAGAERQHEYERRRDGV